jgi:transposase
MPKTPEFRRQMVDLVRAGRDPADLAREFEPTAQSISHWVAQADRQAGRRDEKGGGLTAAERDELARLRRENKQLRLERDILSLPGSHARPARSRFIVVRKKTDTPIDERLVSRDQQLVWGDLR